MMMMIIITNIYMIHSLYKHTYMLSVVNVNHIITHSFKYVIDDELIRSCTSG